MRESDVRHAIAILRELRHDFKRKDSSYVVRSITDAVATLRALGPDTTPLPTWIGFDGHTRPLWGKDGRRIWHVGNRYDNGLISLCSECVPDTYETWAVTDLSSVSCPACRRAVELANAVSAPKEPHAG